MPSRRQTKTIKDANSLGLNVRRLSIPIKRLSESEITEIMKSTDTSLQDVKKWQQEIYDHLKKINHMGVLEEADRVFNMIEAHFPLDPPFPASQFFTTLIMIGASGKMAPTTIVFPNDELPLCIFADERNTANLPQDGFPNDKLLRCMQLIFHPWLISKQKSFPVIVFIDINPVHISWEFLTFCKENQIILLRTTPTVSLQPIGSFILPHLEIAWINALREWSKENENQHIPLETVSSILRQAFEKTVTVDLVTEGFRKSGTFPFDPVTVYKQGMENSTSRQTVNSTRQPHHTLQSITQPSAMDCSQPMIEMSQQEAMSEIESFNDEIPIQQTIVIVPEATDLSATEPTNAAQSTAPQVTQSTRTAHSTAPQLIESTQSNTAPTAPQTTATTLTVQPTATQVTQSTRTAQSTAPQLIETTQSNAAPTAPQITATTHTVQPTAQYHALLGPLTYEFINAGSSWKGAIENTSLFHVWQLLLKSHHHFSHPISQTSHPRAEEINDQLRMQFEGYLGPLLYEFKNSGSVWAGAAENIGLFEVWKQLIVTLQDKSNGQ